MKYKAKISTLTLSLHYQIRILVGKIHSMGKVQWARGFYFVHEESITNVSNVSNISFLSVYLVNNVQSATGATGLLLVSESRLLWSTLRWPCTKSECQKIWVYPNLAQMSIWTSNFKGSLYPSPPPLGNKMLAKYGIYKSSWTSDFKVSLYHPLENEQLADLKVSHLSSILHGQQQLIMGVLLM